MSNRKKRMPGDILWNEDGTGLYGHLDVDAVIEALRPHSDEDWEPDTDRMARSLRHSWMRFVPAQPDDDYRMWAWPATKGTPGAFPVTEVLP